MADRDPPNANNNDYPWKINHPVGIRRGGPPGSRYPNPFTAYGDAPSSVPPRPFTSSPGFGGAAGQLLSAADALSPLKTTRKSPQGAGDAEASAFTAHQSLWAPSADFSFDARPKGLRQAYGGRDERFPNWSVGGPVDHELPRASVREIAVLDGLRSPRFPPAARLHAPAVDEAWLAEPPTPGAEKPKPSAEKPKSRLWENLESLAMDQLGESAEARRAATERVDDSSAFSGCPFTKCRMSGAKGVGAGLMKQHLLIHVQLAAERQNEDDYIKGSVGVLLHDMCLDVEVPPPQRMLERQRMARALLKPSKAGIGLQAALVETKATGNNENLLVRRCSLDLAYGGCKGLKRPEAIRRCDKCRSWFHISCGQMGLGEAISYTEARDEALCRTCSRVSIGAWGKEPGPNVQKHLALLRSKRQQMLALLEQELDSGWPDGVFDLNISTEAGAIRNARGPGGERAAGASKGGTGSSDADAQGLSRPPCATEGCGLRSRPDSRFCSDGCGVRNAQLLLSDALRHSLEERLGRERGRRLKEIREMRIRKHDVGMTLKKLQPPRPPVISPQHEATLHVVVERRRRLWKRLLEIDSYWGTVTGSRSLSVGRPYWQQQGAGARAGVDQAGTTGDVNSGGGGARGGRVGDGGKGDGGSSGRGSGGGCVADGGGSAANGGGNAASSAELSTEPPKRPKRERVDWRSAGQGDNVEGAGDHPKVGQATVAAAAANRSGVEASTKTHASRRRSGAVSVDVASAEREMDVDVGDDASEAPQSHSSGTIPSMPEAVGLGDSNREGGGALRDRQGGREILAAAEAANGITIAAGDPPPGGGATEAKPSKKLKSAPSFVQGNSKEGSRSQVPPQLVPTPLPLPLPLPPPPPEKIPRHGVEHLSCVYCGEETGPEVADHLEDCYLQAAASRNERLESATLLPASERHSFFPGGSASYKWRAEVFGPILPSDTAVAVGRQLLSRTVCYADFDDLPDPRLFQLHDDLKGWMGATSRLDLLWKELVRQRNAAIQELHDIDKEEAALEMHLRRGWMEVGYKRQAGSWDPPRTG